MITERGQPKDKELTIEELTFDNVREFKGTMLTDNNEIRIELKHKLNAGKRMLFHGEETFTVENTI